nr:FCD domain-containing protein [Octadecabacter dasysiphoniae]
MQHRKTLPRGVVRKPAIHGDRRDGDFKKDLLARSDALKQVIDQADHVAAIQAELDLHGLVYEHANNRILLNSWTGLRGHLQLYWAARTGPLCPNGTAMTTIYGLPSATV